MTAFSRSLRAHARRRRHESGFGMVELLIAMTVMAIGLLAVFAMFESSILSITRASITSTTSALADAEMENYRAIRHEVIGIDEADIAGVDGTYTGDGAYESNAADREHVLTCASNPAPCTDTLPTQNLIGADGKQYRVDTYIVNQQVNGGIGRDVKLVTIVVRDGSDPSKEWARVASSFDESTGF